LPSGEITKSRAFLPLTGPSALKQKVGT